MKTSSGTTRRGSTKRRHSKGFTLVEMLVVLAIIAGLGGGAAMMLGILTHGALKSDAMKITAAIKYMYSQAGVNNTRYRIVFDIEQNRYHSEVVQSAEVEAPISAENASNEDDFLTEEAKLAQQKKKKQNDLFDDDEDNPFGINRRVTYQKVQDGVIKPGAFKGGVRIKKIVTGEGDIHESGKISMSFFPNGFQEQVIIYLEDSSGAIFSILTEPLTGRVRLYSKEIDIPEDFGKGEEDD